MWLEMVPLQLPVLSSILIFFFFGPVWKISDYFKDTFSPQFLPPLLLESQVNLYQTFIYSYSLSRELDAIWGGGGQCGFLQIRPFLQLNIKLTNSVISTLLTFQYFVYFSNYSFQCLTFHLVLSLQSLQFSAEDFQLLPPTSLILVLKLSYNSCFNFLC